MGDKRFSDPKTPEQLVTLFLPDPVSAPWGIPRSEMIGNVISGIRSIAATARKEGRLLRMIALLVILGCLTGCKKEGGSASRRSSSQPTSMSDSGGAFQATGRRIGVTVTDSSWRRIETVPRDPIDDLIRLNQFLRFKGGSLVVRPDDAVQWKDNMYCRLFEFPKYSVLLFPFNWTDERFQVVFVAGRLRDHKDIAWDAEFRYDAVAYRHRNESMDLDVDEPSLSAVSFLGVYLGQPQNAAVEVMRRELSHQWDWVPPLEGKDKQIQMREWSLSGRGPMTEGQIGVQPGTTEGKYSVTLFFDRGRTALIEVAPVGFCSRHDVVPPGTIGIHYADEKAIIAGGDLRGADILRRWPDCPTSLPDCQP